MTDITHFLAEALNDSGHGWSIGTFGAIGEFIRDEGEPFEKTAGDGGLQIVTSRGGMRLAACDGVQPIAYETLISDSESWSSAVAFCLPLPADKPRVVRRLGADAQALRPEDRSAILFDMGIGIGHVAMCVRTDVPELIGALEALEGKPLLSAEGHAAGALVLKHSPNRVMLSPLGRIEVYAAIPAADGQSPNGPHTHLLPKLIAAGRTHSANAPIPDGLQPILMLHPRSPWRDKEGRRTPYDREPAAAFDAVLARFGLEEDRTIRASVEQAVRDGNPPQSFAPPPTRRGRAQMRIALRRLAQDMDKSRIAAWQSLYDPASEHDDAMPAHA